MTNAEKKAMMDAVELAINLGASVSVTILPEFQEDVAAFDPILAPNLRGAGTTTATSQTFCTDQIFPFSEVKVIRAIAQQNGSRSSRAPEVAPGDLGPRNSTSFDVVG